MVTPCFQRAGARSPYPRCIFPRKFCSSCSVLNIIILQTRRTASEVSSGRLCKFLHEDSTATFAADSSTRVLTLLHVPSAKSPQGRGSCKATCVQPMHVIRRGPAQRLRVGDQSRSCCVMHDSDNRKGSFSDTELRAQQFQSGQVICKGIGR